MAVEIQSVRRFSRCWFAGVRAGDTLLRVDGYVIEDILDYDFRMSFAPVTMEFSHGGKTRTVHMRTADTGLSFATYLMDKQQHCKNKCIFCFIDQMPPGMRETLYFKDDDSRLSFLQGNYITLTNLSQRELARIIDLRVSPVNISVHATAPAVRTALLRSRRAGECLAVMKRLPADIPPMVIVQHMPPGFTKMYAERLNRLCAMEVREAQSGDELHRGLALIAPADLQCRVVRIGTRYTVNCAPGDKVSGHRPSVDAMFYSMAETVTCKMVGIIMTGMGQDGAHGLLEMRKKGAYTIGQDKESSVVYGMPGVAQNIGAVMVQASCDNVSTVLLRHLKSLG